MHLVFLAFSQILHTHKKEFFTRHLSWLALRGPTGFFSVFPLSAMNQISNWFGKAAKRWPVNTVKTFSRYDLERIVIHKLSTYR